MATRRERVVLQLEDDFTPGVLRAAAATKLLERELNSLSGRAVQTSRATKNIDRDIEHAGASARKAGSDFDRAGNQIDRMSGRMKLLGEAIAVLGPGLVPIAAAAVPAVTGLANAFGFTVIAAGSAVLAFHGVGDALKALNDYQIDPTAAHLQAMQEKMAALGPAGRDFVRELQSLRPVLQGLQDTAQAGLFPGLTEALSTIETRIPDVNRLIGIVTDTLGGLSAEAARALAGREWDGFFNMLSNEARPTLTDLGHALGDVTAGLADLWIAFTPLNRDFSRGLAGMASGFHEWAAGLSQTKGFADFMAYLRQTGPQVLDTVGALAKAVVDIGRAAAPLGGPVLHAVQAFAEAISAIARSDLGTPIFAGLAALSLYNRALKTTEALQASAFATKALPRLKAALTPVISDIGVVGSTWMTAGAKSEREMARMSASARRLGAVMKGAFVVGGVVASIDLISEALDRMLGHNLNESDLGRSLTALAQGRVSGELSKYGSDLSGFAEDVHLAGDQLGWLSQQAAKIPLVGDFLSAPPWTKSPKDAADNINKLDESLAGLVETGQRGQAAAVFERLSAAAKASGVSTAELTKLFPQYTVAVQNAATADGKAAGASRGAANATNAYTQAIKANLQAMRDKRTATLAAGNAEIAYQQAVDDARKSAKENGKTLDINTQKGRNNKTALLGMASAWNNLSDRQQNAQGAFASARKALIDQARQMGATRTQAKRYADQLLNIPSKRTTLIQLNGTDPAIASVKELQRYIDSLHGKTITNYIRNIQTHGPVAGGGHPADWTGSADGGTVPKTGRAYRDRHLYLLADGEEVVSNRYGQADRHRALLKAINAGRLANGGTAGRDRLTRDEFRTYANSFDLTAGMSIASLNKELASFALSIHKAGGHVAADFGRLSRRARDTERAYLRSADTLKKETSLRDKLVQDREQAGTTAAGGFTSDVFGSSLSTMDILLNRDTLNAAKMDSALKAAKAKGLDGALAQGLAQSGNLRLAQQFAGLTPAQIKAQEKAFASRQATLTALSGTAMSFYDPQIAAANAAVQTAKADSARLNRTLQQLERAIEHGAFRTVKIQTHEKAGKIAKEVTKHQRHAGVGG